MIEILLPILKKDDMSTQSIFNTDTSRSNYAAKQTNLWIPDKSGIYLNDTIIKPFCNVVIELMKKFYSEYKKYVNENIDYVKDTELMDEFVKLEDIMNCIISIKDKKLYDSIIFKLSSNLHYKSLIKQEDLQTDDNTVLIKQPTKKV